MSMTSLMLLMLLFMSTLAPLMVSVSASVVVVSALFVLGQVAMSYFPSILFAQASPAGPPQSKYACVPGVFLPGL